MQHTYVHTDLALECRADGDAAALSGVFFDEKSHGALRVTTVEVQNEEGSRRIGKPVGRYITLAFPDPCYMENGLWEELVLLLAQKISFLMRSLCGRAETILVVGLGNRRITADAVGPQTVQRITVTYHLKTLEPRLFAGLGQRSVAAIAPGVLADTGVEAAELVKKTVETVKPDLVIAIDALAARHSDRLGRTVQLSDNGIAPGSGVGNRRMALCKETLGVPVLALGVPTVVNSATLVYDALEKSGISAENDALKAVLENQIHFFVTPKESDAMVDTVCELLCRALDLALAREEVTA